MLRLLLYILYMIHMYCLIQYIWMRCIVMSAWCLPAVITPFWSLFPSFICRNHPFLLQRFWQTIRGYTRWEWLRRCLKAQPIWTLFPAVPFLNHHLMSTANVPYLPYTCPHFCLLPSSTTTSLFLPFTSFFFTVPDYISREDEVIVFLTLLKIKLHKGGGDLLIKGDLRLSRWSSVWSGWLILGRGCTQKWCKSLLLR